MGDGRWKIGRWGDGRWQIEDTAPISELPASNSELRKLVVLESTTYPGTTEEELRAVLEENSPYVENMTR